MNRRVVAAIVAAVLALAGLGIIANWVSEADARALNGAKAQEVYVVVTGISKGTRGEDVLASVEKRPMPAAVVPERAVTDLASLQSRVADVSLVPGEILLDDRFVDPTVATADAVAVPKGMEQISMLLKPEQIRGGIVRPGDKVGIIHSMKLTAVGAQGNNAQPASGTFTVDGKQVAVESDFLTTTILNQVLVVQVQGAVAPAAPSADGKTTTAEGAPSSAVLVTFAVPADQAEKIAWAMNGGNIVLALQTPDTETNKSTYITGSKVFGR